jgi:Cupredoxin-like domain
MMVKRYVAAASFAALCSALVPGVAHAEDLPTFKLEFADGKVAPVRLEVPAGKRFKVTIFNKGNSAVEFESVQLRKEKVLAPGADSFVVVSGLEPGEYKFFDDFHQSTAQGLIVAK